ncbi:EAL domain-containing protein [Aestuariibacter salexigens]|uniref:EAL domain-containing protein n=1 Tax=Aestuariibacter salexigens TaxID=226010 RepID=UPI000688F6A0|nr:EAL domain-containing protein [Aestuariibacter salexigens]
MSTFAQSKEFIALQAIKSNDDTDTSRNSVHGIIQDDIGFIWLATDNGISRFDGYDFVEYGKGKGIRSEVLDLFIDEEGSLWAAMAKGLSVYDESKDEFVTVVVNETSDGAAALSQLQTGELLYATGGQIKQFNISTGELQDYNLRGTVEVPSSIKMLKKDGSLIWVGTKYDGLFFIDGASDTLYSMAMPNSLGITIDYVGEVNDIKRVGDQHFVAMEQGLYTFNILERTSAKVTSLNYMNSDKSNIAFKTIEPFKRTSLLLGTMEGLYFYDFKSQHLSLLSHKGKVTRDMELGNAAIQSTFTDKNGDQWIGTFAKGVFKSSQFFERVESYRELVKSDVHKVTDNLVWGIEQTSDGNIWMATFSAGLVMFDPLYRQFENYLLDSDLKYFDIVIDKSDRIWLASSSGIHIYEYSARNGLTEVATLLDNNLIDRIEFFSSSVMLWAGGDILASINPETLQISTLSLNEKKLNKVGLVHQDKKGRLWLDTNLGINVFDPDTQSMQQVSTPLDEPRLIAVHEYDEGYLMATSEHGIIKVDRHLKMQGRPIRNVYTEEDYLVSALFIGREAWLAGREGVLRISLENGEILEHLNNDILQGNDLAEGAAFIANDGRIYFGGTYGFHIFNPNEKLNTDDSAPGIPYITSMEVFNDPIAFNEESKHLTAPTHLAERVTLKHDDFPFDVNFASLNPIATERVYYEYKLDGRDNQWIRANNNRNIEFNDLPYGHHKLQLRARYEDGPWSRIRSLDIYVEPPVWFHPNALIFYAFFSSLLLLYWFKQYSTRKKQQQAIKESEERLKLTLWSSGDELWDWDLHQGQVIRSNTWGTLDFPQDDIRTNSAYQANIHPNDIKRVQDTLNAHLKEETEHFETTYRAKTFKGEWIWLLDRGKVVRRDSNGQPLRMTGTLKNISHLKQAEEQLKLFQRSVETISDGVFIADTNFKFITINKSYCKYTGETREQALASFLRFHQYPEAFTEEVKKALRQKGNWFGEVESRRVNGERYVIDLNIDAIKDEDGKNSHYVGVFSDITDRKSTEKELLKLANTDPLTELPNRSFFQASHSNLVRKNTPHALICMDMDNFKKINDSLGHQTGDILIKQIAKRLQKITGTSATCYRLGGDEFAVLLENHPDMHSITHFAQRMLDDMARPFIINKQEFVLGGSVGIAFYPEDGHSSQELLKNADTAMYFAKNSGGNKYQFFSGEMNQSAVRQLQIENLIRHGLKEDLFTVFYQPKVDIMSGKLVSMEALVRFEHPEKGFVSPSQFIPLAENTGQIIEIGEQVLRKACKDTKRWVEMGLFTGRVAVNISAKQFELPDLDDRIESVLREVGLSALHLECEITEGTLMEQPDHALRMMDRLREKGIHLALDDFGTGYSSLAYLKKFPLNTLKIDKAFIDDIANSSVDRHMAAAIINIAHNLGLKVVAEGVEKEDQLSILRRYECEMLQGYLYSKPLSSARFERLLKENAELHNLIQHS